jgi:23S rRNA pseudouridine1911/1915/1917 synthase
MSEPPVSPELKDALWEWTVDDRRAGGRADRELLSAVAEGLGRWESSGATVLSRSQLQRLMEEGQVTQDGAALRPSSALRAGATVRVRVPAPRPVALVPEDRPLEILHEDAHLLVLNKPPGLTVHPSPTQMEGTLVHALLHRMTDLSGIGGELRPGIVHRLDKDTSGALVVSKTDQAHRALVEIFSRHEIERAYWALCYGCPAPLSGRIETHLGRNPADRKKMAVLPARASGARLAITHYRVRECYGGARFASFVEATLETGRTHQIRVHLTSIGHGVLGDPVYGTPSARQPKWTALPEDVRAAVAAAGGQALHARVLGFTHPVTGERLRFEAAPPPAFRLLLEALQRYR